MEGVTHTAQWALRMPVEEWQHSGLSSQVTRRYSERKAKGRNGSRRNGGGYGSGGGGGGQGEAQTSISKIYRTAEAVKR